MRRSFSLFLAGLFLLYGCGQMGPLYLPKSAKSPAKSLSTTATKSA